jgi:TFIIF-interacting CTD phosphatase-like protein
MRDGTAFVRAYTEQFITTLSKYCNIVYWTDLMPDQINPLLQKLPKAHHLFQYHCRRVIKNLYRKMGY